jgi:hypothetical protein
VDYRINQMKGLNPSERLSLQYYTANAKVASLQAEAAQKKKNEDDAVAYHEQLIKARNDAIAAGLEKTRMTTDASLKRQMMADTARKMMEAAREDHQSSMQDKMIAARTQWQDAGLDDKDFIANMNGLLKQQQYSDTFISSLFRSQSMASSGTPAPSAAPAPKLPSPPQRGGGSGGGGGGQPPVPGAKKAPDGKWYVHDPKRPGKYLEVH